MVRFDTLYEKILNFAETSRGDSPAYIAKWEKRYRRY